MGLREKVDIGDSTLNLEKIVQVDPQAGDSMAVDTHVDTEPDADRLVDVDLTGKFRLNLYTCYNYIPFKPLQLPIHPKLP